MLNKYRMMSLPHVSFAHLFVHLDTTWVFLNIAEYSKGAQHKPHCILIRATGLFNRDPSVLDMPIGWSLYWRRREALSWLKSMLSELRVWDCFMGRIKAPSQSKLKSSCWFGCFIRRAQLQYCCLY